MIRLLAYLFCGLVGVAAICMVILTIAMRFRFCLCHRIEIGDEWHIRVQLKYE